MLHSSRQTARRWLRGLTTATTAAGLVLVAAPVVVAGHGTSSPPPAASTTTEVVEDSLQLVGRKHRNRVMKRYRVRPGDTPSSIAVRYHAWTDELIALNGRTLYVGEVIRIPVVKRAQRQCERPRHTHHRTNVKQRNGQHAAPAKAGKNKAKSKDKKNKKKPAKAKAGKKDKKKTKTTKKRPHRTRHLHGWHHADASRAKVRRTIARKARRHGVNPDLALAIAWQESGWQQRRISSAGALGAMQIMPGTGRWISQIVGHRLNPRDLYHNATTGVRLIRILRKEARPRIAIAGYYQGLAGVRKYGMYPSTKLYVANVLALKKRIERGWSPG